IQKSIEAAQESIPSLSVQLVEGLHSLYQQLEGKLDPSNRKKLEEWLSVVSSYANDYYSFEARGKEIKIKPVPASLSHRQIPKSSLQTDEAWGDLLRWLLRANVPGSSPYTSGVFPFRREVEDPTRMFAGEGGPERTNTRFH